MIDKNTILKFVKHVHKRGRGIADRRMLNPQRDWLIGIGVSAATIGVATVFSVNLFTTYKNIDQQTYEVDKELPAYQTEVVLSVLETFSKREVYFNALVEGIQPRVEVVEEVATTTTTLEAEPTEDFLNQTESVSGGSSTNPLISS